MFTQRNYFFLSIPVGLVMTGSAVYIVLSSSGVIWTALLSRYILKKRMSRLVCVGVTLTFIGLVSKGFFVSTHPSENKTDLIIGCVLVLMGVCLQSATYVLTELFLTSENHSIEGPNFVFIHGMMNSTILSAWFVWYCGLPGSEGWNRHFTERIANAGGSPKLVVLGYFLILLSAMIRSNILWYIQKYGGAITLNVLKGARAGIVVVLSHVLYCNLNPAQCLTPIKAFSSFCCIFGVFIYGLGRRQEHEKAKQASKLSKTSHSPHLSIQRRSTRSLPHSMSTNSRKSCV
eukprot:GHVN01013810.1.p1 GENE.GHVN01013810.1~~GHVN01013810.1.p1  ORF type:complete len:289 (-),score=22.41 GHVN01013810.1:357-1223(-)